MMILECNMKIKKLFVNTMILLFSDYQDFWSQADNEFEYERYTESFESQWADFYSVFIKTHMFSTFLQDSDEERTMEIKEFLSYYSLLKSTSTSNSRIKYASFGRNIFEEHSPSDNEECEDSISPSKRDTTKLKALIFKQNMEILHLLEAFEEESCCEPQFNHNINDDVIQIKFLDQNFDNLQTPDKYQSSKKLPGFENSASKILFGQTFQGGLHHHQGRKRCDSGKLDAKDFRELPQDYKEANSSEERSPVQFKQGTMTERSSFESQKRELINFFGSKHRKKECKKSPKSKPKSKGKKTREPPKSFKSSRKVNNSDSVVLFDLSKHVCLSSVPTVEVNVVSSEKGTEDLSVASKSVGKVPNKNISHYRPILDNKSNGGRLSWSNNKHSSIHSENISRDEEYSEDILKNSQVSSPNKPPVSNKPQLRERVGKNDACLAQSIPVLSLKAAQIPLVHMTSCSPPRGENLVPKSLKKMNSINSPIDRTKKFTLRKDCNSDHCLKKQNPNSAFKPGSATSIKKQDKQTQKKSHQPLKSFRRKNIKKYGKPFSTSPNAKTKIERYNSGSKKIVKNNGGKRTKRTAEDLKNSVKNNPKNLVIRKSLLCHQNHFKSSSNNSN